MKVEKNLQDNFIFQSLTHIGSYFLFTKQSMQWLFRSPYRWPEFFKHMEFIGNKSVFIICLTGFFTGMVLSFQIYLGFSLINAENLVGPTVGLGIFRELGPVLTGLIVSARAGGAMAARLGTMRVTEQIDALDLVKLKLCSYSLALQAIVRFGTAKTTFLPYDLPLQLHPLSPQMAYVSSHRHPA